MGFVFTNFQANNYGTSSGEDEGNYVYNWTVGEISQYKYCRYGWGQAYESNRNIKGGGWMESSTELYEIIGGDEGKSIPKIISTSARWAIPDNPPPPIPVSNVYVCIPSALPPVFTLIGVLPSY